MENRTKEIQSMEMGNIDPILSDKDIIAISEYTPFPEGEVYLADDEIFGFWAAARQVATASAAEVIELKTGQARALFYMRSFYLLGVLRGAEAYRFLVMDEEEGPSQIPFTLDDFSSKDFLDSLKQLPPDEFQRLCALLGLSVQW